VFISFNYDLHGIENCNHAFCANDPWKLTLEVGVTFSIVVMRVDEAMKQFTVNVGTPIQESSEI
jgi:hypothetical protein